MHLRRQDSEGGDLIVEPTEEGRVQLHGENCSLTLTPEQAYLPGRALLDAAADASQAME